MDNIILIGMPGAGKSTVGVILAKTIGYDFVDVDIHIAKREGMPLQDILDQKGIEAFLAIEADVAHSLTLEKTVIATGGSLALSNSAMAHLKQSGRCVFLDVALPTLEQRLSNIKNRGVAAGPGKTIAQIEAERRPFYESAADVTISCGDDSVEKTVEEIISALNL